MNTPIALLSSQRRAQLNRRSLHLAYATAGYNLLEGVVAVIAGAAASSTALLGFGLDSFVEVSSALVVIWQFRSRMPETRERLALRLIAVSFFALAAWVAVDALRSLFDVEQAVTSPVGIAIAATSVVVMPLLVWAKRRTGRELGSATVVADSMQTMLCTYLSAIVLVGLLLNATLGWWWADPIAGLVIAAVAVREGVEMWRGEQCDDCAVVSVAVREGVEAWRGEQCEDCADPAADGNEQGRGGCEPGCTGACCTSIPVRR
ncbi:cation diffusion facilitator family transporter [Couchioplanes caeruleus]|uniref:Cation efflux family protein n=1 Tax=Couchioplanes caeruleus TaxID=56438 RepID=A0A3N1GJB1_9ACTN|nr:cation transporter [Couchioplanes caeruleus]ROP30363.1 cation efflux family protein [Couchioplanes caeruleus]